MAQVVIRWTVMSSSKGLLYARHLAAGAAASAALLLVGVPLVAAAPASDDRGYVDSTARCAAPDSAVAFGRTASSRVAICAEPDGSYEYRGVRVRDGAKLIIPAEPDGDGGFVAENGGVSYTVTASSLVVAEGNRVIRDEPMVEFQEIEEATEAPETPSAPESPAQTTPLPPPLAAEVGG